MGHLGNMKQEYYELSKRLDKNVVGFPEPENETARKGWVTILELLYTPEEAMIGSVLPTFPASLETIAKKKDISKDKLKEILDHMADKGIVMDLINPETKEVLYSLSPPIVGFLELTMMKMGDQKVSQKDLADALSIYGGNSEAFVKEVHGSGKTALGRALVYDSLIKEDLIPSVYEWEKVVEIVNKAEIISVSNCFCRHKAEHLGKRCSAPMETCLSLDDFGRFVIRRNFGREISKGEAIEILKDCRKHHLVHLVDNVKNKPAWICNCCKCCCGALNAINKFDFPAVNPSDFKPKLLGRNCVNCLLCEKVCPVNAISSNSNGIYIDTNRCIGCGVCASACPQSDITLERREKTNFVPDSKIELLMLRAFERNKLAEFVYDNGEQYGTSFLNLVVKVISTLPQKDQDKALNQLDSKFVHYIMKHKD
ncbi:4Fe-4S binding protein [Clostridium sp. E02]|uniref:4Fe-4S binding protein n=1 Tax=Clostridium sp. E02 TaxID=2487134 RepID=UPI000F52D959|nr:4Fe-4S binding protein [Clostridium sp. E02]